METTLDKLPINKIGIVKKLNSKSEIKRRLLDLGMISETSIKPIYKSPLGDPTAYLMRGSVIALRSDDAKDILISYKGDKNA